MIDLGGKRALVTGAARRVGAAIARALGAAKMKVAVHHHGSDPGETCAAIVAAGGEATPLSADLYDRAQTRALVDAAVSALGGLDLLVVSAANFDRVPFDMVDDSAWDRALALNVTAPFVLAHQAREALRASRGSIVVVTCTSATTPYRNHLPYVVSKGAAQKLVRVLALELAPDVRVNAVAPGTVLPPEDTDAATLAALAARTPLERIGTAADVADAVLYLARAPFVTGQELLVDGGRTVAGLVPTGSRDLAL